nr:MBL fold metallo-hydrolase [uncultured Desulfobacter sp.]
MLITGKKKSLLVEAGVSGMVDQVIRQLDDLEIFTDMIVVSHPHADHVTGIPGLTDRFKDARIIADTGAQKFMAHPKAEHKKTENGHGRPLDHHGGHVKTKGGCKHSRVSQN